jgi:lysophospholipase L1-like esterase
MARARAAKAVSGIAGGVLIVLGLVLSAAAEEAAPTTQPYTQECQKGGDALVAESPLPNVAAALANRKTLTILTIGASAAAGRRSTRGGYTRLIETILERAVKGIDVVMINRGISGELAADAAVRIKTEVALDRPELVIWQVGTNDALAYISLNFIRDTVVDTIRWLRRHKVDVILVGLQRVSEMRRNEHYNAVRDELRKIAADENVIIVRRDEAMELIDRAKTEGGVPLPDEFEETEIGYTCLAQYVARAITLGVFGKNLRRDRPRDEQPQQPQQPQQ